jgi:hypothetical protein
LAELVESGGKAALPPLFLAPLKEAGIGCWPAEVNAEAVFDFGDGLGGGSL